MRTCKAVQSGQPKEFWISTFFTFWSATVIHTKKCLMDRLLLWIRLDLIPIFSWQLVTFLVFCWALFLYKSPKKTFSAIDSLPNRLCFEMTLVQKMRFTDFWNFYPEAFGFSVRNSRQWVKPLPSSSSISGFFIEISLVTS